MGWKRRAPRHLVLLAAGRYWGGHRFAHRFDRRIGHVDPDLATPAGGGRHPPRDRPDLRSDVGQRFGLGMAIPAARKRRPSRGAARRRAGRPGGVAGASPRTKR